MASSLERRTKRRSFEAKLRYALLGTADRVAFSKALADLQPYTTDKPLIRFGGEGDGGYMLPDDLDGLEGSYSPGVNEEISYDLAMAARNIPGFLIDASIDCPSPLPKGATFDPLFLGEKTEGTFISLQDWVNRYSPDSNNLIMQMDIEGAEYDSLLAAPDETLLQFRIIAIEFHKLHHLVRPKSLAKMAATFAKMAKHFVPVHIHPNNVCPPVSVAGKLIPPLVEVTYLRRDHVKEMKETTQFPHPLDAANVPSRPDYPMPPIWE